VRFLRSADRRRLAAIFAILASATACSLLEGNGTTVLVGPRTDHPDYSRDAIHDLLDSVCNADGELDWVQLDGINIYSGAQYRIERYDCEPFRI
jgi:hypothetical protein